HLRGRDGAGERAEARCSRTRASQDADEPGVPGRRLRAPDVAREFPAAAWAAGGPRGEAGSEYRLCPRRVEPIIARDGNLGRRERQRASEVPAVHSQLVTM